MSGATEAATLVLTMVDDTQLYLDAASLISQRRYKAAFGIYSELANRGYPACRAYAGWMLYEGVGVEKDRERAIDCFRQAAEEGSREGMFYLGRVLTAKGQHADAIPWYQEAAALRYPPALYRLGIAHLEGTGVVRNRGLGLELLQQAASAGNVLAKRKIAIEFISGRFGIRRVFAGLCLLLGTLGFAWRAAKASESPEEFLG